MKRKQLGFTAVEGLLAVIFLAAVGFGGWYVYHKNHKSSPSNSVTNTTTTNKSSGPYDGWKTYTTPEAKTISFKYPSNWTVTEDSNNSFSRNVSVVDPDTYQGSKFTLQFIYASGKNNILDQECGGSGSEILGIGKTENVTLNGKKLKIITATVSNPMNVSSTSMYLRDAATNCDPVVKSGTIEMIEHCGATAGQECAKSVDLKTWESLPASTSFDLIFKSLKF